MLTSSESSATRIAANANNNHRCNKSSQEHTHSQVPPSIAFNRSINETTCTTVANIPCHLIKQKCSHPKTKSEKEHLSSCQCSSKKNHQTISTSFLHQPLSFHKSSSNLCNIFHSLSFENLPSKIQDNILPILSNDYQIHSKTNNEQFQLLKTQFQTYLNDIQFNTLSRVIQLLSLYNHLNNEQIKDLLHNFGYSHITIEDINRITINDRRIFVNEKFKNFRTTLNEYKKKQKD